MNVRIARAPIAAAFCVALSSLLWAQQQPRDVRQSAIKLGTATLAGIVVTDDASAKPLRRVNIGILGTDEPQVRLTMTDDSGRFVMPALPAGRYLISASKPPYVDTVYGARLPGRPGTPIVLKDGERRGDLLLKMIRGGAITGAVTDEHGRPAVGVNVELLQPQTRAGDQMLASVMTMLSGMLLPRQVTDDRGVYRFSGLPPGDYIVSATPANLGGGDAIVQTADEVQSAARAAAETPRPQAAATAPPPRSTVVGPNERPARPVVESGMQFMNFPMMGAVGGPGMTSGRTVGYAPVYYPGTTNAAEATPIAIAAGDERTEVDLVARPVPTTRITGTVFEPDGQPARGVSVQLRAEDRVETLQAMFTNMARVNSTGSDGTFILAGIAPGRYTLNARTRGTPPGPPGAPGSARPGPPSQALWAAMEISAEGQPITGLSLTLQPGMTLSGRVVVDPSSPSATLDVTTINIGVRPTRSLDLTAFANSATRVSADGTFTVTGLVPGTYRLSASSFTPGAALAWMDVSVRLGGRDVADLPFDLRPGDSITDVVLTMTDRQQAVSGTLQDASGRPATEFTMILFPAEKAYWLPDSRRIRTARPATDGRFAFPGPQGPPPGDYLLAAVTDLRPNEHFDPAFLEALAKEAIKLRLNPGEQKTQDIRLVGR